MSDAARYIVERRETDCFERYIKRVGRIMPALAGRVFALRRHLYIGCGFHWNMERELGLLLLRVNDFENVDMWHGKNVFATRTIIKVSAQMLFESVAAAERSVDPSAKRTRDLRAKSRRENRARIEAEGRPGRAGGEDV